MIITCPECKSRDDYEKYVSVRFVICKTDAFDPVKDLKISRINCTGCRKTIEWAEEVLRVKIIENKEGDKDERETPMQLHITRKEYSIDKAKLLKDRAYNVIEYDSSVDRYRVTRRNESV